MVVIIRFVRASATHLQTSNRLQLACSGHFLYSAGHFLFRFRLSVKWRLTNRCTGYQSEPRSNVRCWQPLAVIRYAEIYAIPIAAYWREVEIHQPRISATWIAKSGQEQSSTIRKALVLTLINTAYPRDWVTTTGRSFAKHFGYVLHDWLNQAGTPVFFVHTYMRNTFPYRAVLFQIN